jgi:transcriptional regulator with XRE-family HTH domain
MTTPDQQRLAYIGQKLRQKRNELGLSQAELGRRVGTTQNTISRYELGLIPIADNLLPLLAQALSVETIYFSVEDFEPTEVSAPTNEIAAPGTPVRATATPPYNFIPVHHQTYDDDVVTFHLPEGTTLFGLYLGEDRQGYQIRLVNGETWMLQPQDFQLSPLSADQSGNLARLQTESARVAMDRATASFYIPAQDQTFEVVMAELKEKYYTGEGDLAQVLGVMHRALTEAHAANLTPVALAPLEWQMGFLWYLNDPTQTSDAEVHLNRALPVYEAELLAGTLNDTEKPSYIQHTAIGLVLLASITQAMTLIERMNYLVFRLDDTNPVKTELLCAITTILLHHGKAEAAREYASSAWQLYAQNVSGRGTKAETCLRDRLVHLDKRLGQAIVPKLPDSELADDRPPVEPLTLTTEQRLLRQFGALSPQRQDRVLDYIRWQLHQQASEG